MVGLFLSLFGQLVFSVRPHGSWKAADLAQTQSDFIG